MAADIALIGGGHAHVSVLADWIANGPPATRTALVTPQPYLRYSGMMPGWLSGTYGRDEGRVDLAALARRAKVRLIEGYCTSIDPDRRRIETDRGDSVDFAFASIDSGGVGRAARILGDDPRIVDIRPIEAFTRALAAIRDGDALSGVAHIAVAGGGAGGTELAFALRNLAGAQARPAVSLVTGMEGLLPGFARAVRKTAARALAAQDIALIEADARIAGGNVYAGSALLEPVDLVVAALGSAAPDWPGEGGLECDADGFIAVDRHQRSVSHSHVLAVGDVAARRDRDLPHSGVHAVFAGPVIARNLRAMTSGEVPSASYTPRWNSLYLMTTGDGRAIASYGPLAAHGAWVAQLKHWIDTRWIAKYERLATDA